MFRSLFPLRRLLATTFLVVFVNVFVGQCWCATLTAPAARAAQPAPCHTAPVPVAKPSCHGHAKASGPQKAHKAPAHAPAGKHDCCKDKSASLLSALTKPNDKGFAMPTPALLPAVQDFHFRPAAGQWDVAGNVVLVPGHYLPPKIPDIRIFIQSLTV
ncbi:hypothetical protein [Hymenobacter cellulosivorans]|uniref:Uncharacterized protein n=1 Tax=Hymenobacter cellulosivorans TaxID=2932249 RepID=A0ABY4F3U0_9BACT|nr:hypothetical protein [Hymenobacter cellulosivorans]UOQ50733.1 hypothetical protein MUN80_13285 [Hymenobacter cellulosivorans]